MMDTVGRKEVVDLIGEKSLSQNHVFERQFDALPPERKLYRIEWGSVIGYVVLERSEPMSKRGIIEAQCVCYAGPQNDPRTQTGHTTEIGAMRARAQKALDPDSEFKGDIAKTTMIDELIETLSECEDRELVREEQARFDATVTARIGELNSEIDRLTDVYNRARTAARGPATPNSEGRKAKAYVFGDKMIERL